MELFLLIFLILLTIGLAYTFRHHEKLYTQHQYRPRQEEEPTPFDEKLAQADEKNLKRKERKLPKKPTI
jgi:hypothetical protein